MARGESAARLSSAERERLAQLLAKLRSVDARSGAPTGYEDGLGAVDSLAAGQTAPGVRGGSGNAPLAAHARDGHSSRCRVLCAAVRRGAHTERPNCADAAAEGRGASRCARL